MTTPDHLTLGELIEHLRAEPNQAKRVKFGLAEPHSYRGYYEQLAFEPTANVTVAEMLSAAEGALGATFQGYKGGDFVMGEWTDTWLANYGECGETIGALLLARMLADEVTDGPPDPYGEIVVQWNGPVVLEAPARARISLELVHNADPRALTVNGSTITIGRHIDGGAVSYCVTGWDDRGWLLVERTSP